MDETSSLNGVEREPIGRVARGSLAEGVEMTLEEEHSVEELRAGKLVVIEGTRYHFYALITDVTVGSMGQTPAPPSVGMTPLHNPAARGSVHLLPVLMRERSAPVGYSPEHLLPVRTIPAPFSPVLDVTTADVERIFGTPDDASYLHLGNPLGLGEASVALHLDRFTERSNAVFGRFGTGKTSLASLCLCGIIQRNKAVSLIFDMHSEYGWRAGDTHAAPRGLKQVFGERVELFTLDRAAAERRHLPYDHEIRLPYSLVTVDDILLLQRELNLTLGAIEAAYLIVNRFGSAWLVRILDMEAEEIEDFARMSGGQVAALTELKRKMATLAEHCKGFLVRDSQAEESPVFAILECLEAGRNVVVEFGQYGRPLQYMLVTNILTRRIHEQYVRKTNLALGDGGKEPLPLIITIEEARRFLSPSLAAQTIFGTIAREMSKYNMTLFLVDERPSGLDAEVLAHLGTRIVCLLDDEKERGAVMVGLPNASGLRSVLASMESKRQALLVGHAVPMPMLIQTRAYDDTALREQIGMVPVETLIELEMEPGA